MSDTAARPAAGRPSWSPRSRLVHVPLGDYMARVYTVDPTPAGRAGALPAGRRRPRRGPAVAASTPCRCSAFSLVSVLLLYALQRLQPLPAALAGAVRVSRRRGVEHRGLVRDQHQLAVLLRRVDAWATWCRWPGSRCRTSSPPRSAWPSPSRWSAASPAPAPTGSATSGSTWSAGVVRILLPLAVRRRRRCCWSRGRGAEPRRPDRRRRPWPAAPSTITGGPVASQEAIKELGTNGGGFFNANSPHPFENPTPLTNLLEIFLLLRDPVRLTRTFGRMVGDSGRAARSSAAMARAAGLAWSRSASCARGEPRAGHGARSWPAAPMEGKEARFGVAALGAVRGLDHRHVDRRGQLVRTTRFTAARRRVALVNMMLGEVAPGRGRRRAVRDPRARDPRGVPRRADGRAHPGVPAARRSAAREIKLVVALHPDHAGARAARDRRRRRRCRRRARRRCSTPGRTGCPRCSTPSPRPPTTTAPRSPGFSAAPRFYNTALGLAMLLGRFLPIVLVLALAGSLARQQPVPATAGTLPTHTPAVRRPARRRRSSSSPASPSSPPWRSARSRRPCSEHTVRRALATGTPDAPARPSPARGGGACSTRRCCSRRCPTALRKLDPRHHGPQPGDVRRRVGAVLDHRAGRRATRACSPGRSRSWLWLTVLFANLAEAVAEGRGKAQAATLRATRTETIARRLRDGRHRGAGPGTAAARRRPGGRRGRRGDPRRRRRRRGHRQRRRVGDHRRVRPGDPRVRRRPSAGHRRHQGAVRPDRRADHRQARRDASSTG